MPRCEVVLRSVQRWPHGKTQRNVLSLLLGPAAHGPTADRLGHPYEARVRRAAGRTHSPSRISADDGPPCGRDGLAWPRMVNPSCRAGWPSAWPVANGAPQERCGAYRWNMSYWLTIEVRDGAVPADGWRRARGESLIEAALTNGARHWEWHAARWGLILELEFRDEEARNAFRTLPAVIAALDAVPDPVSGLLVYPGRGGGSGAGMPRRPRPAPVAGAAEAVEPRDQFLDLALS